ncbi:MAG TPA: hypothetical protein QF762_07700, partial [Acidimicrobiales bacterium]|nr:hypothetical protein [Acidimicrobiales bacterium]
DHVNGLTKIIKKPGGLEINTIYASMPSEECLPPIHQRAAVSEASAQSMPIHGLGKRPGAAEAAVEFDKVLDCVLTGGHSE